MAAVGPVGNQPTIGRLIINQSLPPAAIGRWKLKYPNNHEKWLDGNFTLEQAKITSVGAVWISLNFGPSENYDRVVEYPLDYVSEMLTRKLWDQPVPDNTQGWPVAILMNRLRHTKTVDFYKAEHAQDRDVSDWRLETLHLSSAAWGCALEWLAREADLGGGPGAVQSLYQAQEIIMQTKEPEDNDSDDDVDFANSANDVLQKHHFPLRLPSGHLNGVRSLPSCTQNATNKWKIYRLSKDDGGSDPKLAKCDRDWPSPTAVRAWREIANNDHISKAEGRYTSAFSEMGVRVHRRLMAKADVAKENGKKLSELVIPHTFARNRETEFNEWLAKYFDGAQRTHPAWEELAYFINGVGPAPGDGALDPIGASHADIEVLHGAVRNYAPCRETQVHENVHWPHSDCWIVHHFAQNAWVAICAWAKEHTTGMTVKEAEVAVIWPFGLHTGKAGAMGSRAACGKPFETRVDLVCEFLPTGAAADAEKEIVIIEFKTKMERTNPYKDVYLLNKGTDCRQPVLNAWLYYFQTLQLPSKCLLVYTTRREKKPVEEADSGLDHAIVGEIDFKEVANMDWCIELISTFARGAYGGFSNGRYADSRILVPDLRRLMNWSKSANKAVRKRKSHYRGKRPPSPTAPTREDFNDRGYLHLFRELLPGSRFQCLLECVVDGTAAKGRTAVRNRLKLPSRIRIPKGARVTNCGEFTDEIRLLGNYNDLKRLSDNWRSEPVDDNEKPTYGSAYLAYDDEQVHWLPIILDGDGRPLLLCNAKVHPEKFKFEIGSALPSQVVGAQAILPAGGSNILRRSALLSLNSRLSLPAGMATHPLTLRRRELNVNVANATNRVLSKLRRYLTRDGVAERERFWNMTVEEIYRTNLISDGPRIREFRVRDVRCAAPPDITKREHNYECVERCINRLLNTRLMRAMLALGGHSDFTRTDIDDGGWTEERLGEFRRKELKALERGLHESSNTTGQTRDPYQWWMSQGPGFQEDRRTRIERFPHMSQRVMWSAAAFECVLAPVGGGAETMVDLVADTVESCLRSALEEYLH